MRPRSEEIPLEDFRRSQNSSPLPSSHNSSRPSTPLRNDLLHGNTSKDINCSSGIILVTPISSEETSFMHDQRISEQKKSKGVIETV